jgi:hypothetical protein
VKLDLKTAILDIRNQLLDLAAEYSEDGYVELMLLDIHDHLELIWDHIKAKETP